MTQSLVKETSLAQVINVPSQRLEEAVDVLTRAFRDYPVSRYIFQENLLESDEMLREFFRFACAVRFGLDLPLPGVEVDGKLVAAALIDEPGSQEWPAPLVSAYEQLKERIGPEAAARLENYSRVSDQHRPKEPHYFLGILGVHPYAQGKGYARLLLDEVHEMSQAHPESTGVALDTETTPNVALYQHFGYQVTGEDALDDVGFWAMFRPDERKLA